MKQDRSGGWRAASHFHLEILGGPGLAAFMAFAAAAHAQTVGAPAGKVAPLTTPPDIAPVSGANGEIVITGSRIARAGFVAPTPVTAVTIEQLRVSGPNDIGDGLATIPAFRGASVRPTDNGSGSSNGNAGASLLSLRGLGPNRTLVLLDGRRVVASNVSGATDINLIPQDLVRNVEVVRGGASAAYGSDAVAGVVNFLLDTKFQGIKGSVQGGISRYGDAASYKASLTGGAPLGELRHQDQGRHRLAGRSGHNR